MPAMGSRPPSRDTLSGPVLEISVSARFLKKMDFLSLSDPFVVLYTRGWPQSPPIPSRLSTFTPNDPAWVYHGETEVVWDCLFPRFARRFFLPDGRATGVNVPANAELRFEVYDADTTDTTSPLSAHDFIGAYTIDVSNLGRRGAVLSNLADKGGKMRAKLGQIVLSTERYRLPLDGRELVFSLTFGEGVIVPPGESLFYTLTRESLQPDSDEESWGGSGGGTDWIVLHRSGAMRPPKGGELETSLEFQDARLTVVGATAGDMGRLMCVDVYLYRANGLHVHAGRSEPFSLRMLRSAEKGGQYVVFAPPPRSEGSGGTGGGIITGGDVYIAGHIVPEFDDDGSEVESFGERSHSGSSSMDRTIRIARGVGNVSLAPDAPSVINVRFTHLSWSVPKRGILDGPGGGLRTALKIKSARV